MDYLVEDAIYVRDDAIWLRFHDGTQGEVDLGPELWGEVFEPVVSRFLGIVISMYHREHGLPRFHAVYGEYRISVEVESGVVHGSFRRGPCATFSNGGSYTSRSCWPTGNGAGDTRSSSASRRWSDDMDYDVMEARYVRDHVIWLRFRDGTAGEVDLRPELWGEVFEPLLDVEYFKQFTVHPELQTLVWPNGADFAPEFLHEAVRVRT